MLIFHTNLLQDPKSFSILGCWDLKLVMIYYQSHAAKKKRKKKKAAASLCHVCGNHVL